MPRETFVYPVEEREARELAKLLKEYPELKSYRLSVIWPLDEERKQMLRILADENSLTTEDEQFLIDKSKGAPDVYESSAALEILRIKTVYKDAIGNKMRRGTKRWLLGSRKAIFATPVPEAVAQRLAETKRQFDELRKEFPDVFGIIILGSAIKGYAGHESDLDYILLTNNQRALELFKTRLEERGIVCHAISKGIPKEEVYTSKEKGWWGLTNPADFFEGLYLGDRNALLAYQQAVVSNVDEERWKTLRDDVKWTEMLEMHSRYKAGEHLAIGDYEIDKINATTLLTRVPPPLEEARRHILGKGKK